MLTIKHMLIMHYTDKHLKEFLIFRTHSLLLVRVFESVDLRPGSCVFVYFSLPTPPQQHTVVNIQLPYLVSTHY